VKRFLTVETVIRPKIDPANTNARPTSKSIQKNVDSEKFIPHNGL
jgi:hypothetical protein